MGIETSPSFVFTTASAGSTMPTWNYQGTTGDYGAGGFVTDAANSLNTTSLKISAFTMAGSDCSWLANVTAGCLMLFRDMDGQSAGFTIREIDALNDSGLGFIFQLQSPIGNLNWAGTYTLTFYPTI